MPELVRDALASQGNARSGHSATSCGFRSFSGGRKEPRKVLVQHPVTTQIEHAKDQINITIAALIELGMQTVIIYPNSDPHVGYIMIFAYLKIFRYLFKINFCRFDGFGYNVADKKKAR